MLKILLINPFVHDFSAFNLWSAPLGLYNVLEYLSQFDAELHLIDCLDAPIKQKIDGRSHILKKKIQKPSIYAKIPRFYYQFGISEAKFRQKVEELLPIDAFLLTSGMSYWYPGIQETIRILREISPKTPIILGGIYATLYSEHAKKISGADSIFTGPISEKLFPELKPSSHPKHWSEFVPVKNYAPILTSYGCPMKCTYCASHILNPKFTQKSPAEVFEEISLLYKKGVRHFAFYDDALLVNSERHIIPILKMATKEFQEINFYTPVGLQSRLITKEVARTLKRANFSYIRIGYETSNPERQKETGGKIYDKELEAGIRNLTAAGFRPDNIGVFIMYGLPDQTLEEVANGVNFVKKFGVKIALTEYSPIPGTIETAKLSGLDLNEPLLTNNTAYSHLFSLYDTDKINQLKLSAQYK